MTESLKNRSLNWRRSRLYHIVNSIFFFFLLVFCFWFIDAVNSRSVEASSSIKKRFVYYVYWSGIRAGTAVLDYEETSEGITIKTHATSAEVLSLFYKVDDVAQSTLYPDGYPKMFSIKIREGRHRRHKEAFFEPRKAGKSQKVIYHNKLKNNKTELYLDTPAYDPLSAFYSMTKMDLEEGQIKYLDIFDNKKVWHTEIQVIKKEKVSVLAGEFSTVLIKPLLKSEGIFRKTGDMYIWLTDDKRKLPVLLKSKVVIGTFTAELAEGDH